MIEEVFQEWATKVFIPEIIKRREELKNADAPTLLIMDGHDSRRNSNLMKQLQDQKIDVITLPEHSTHLLQPLDIGFFSSFKRQLEKLKFHLKGLKTAERRKRLLQNTKQALYIAAYPDQLENSWKKSGLHPLNQEIVLQNELVVPREEDQPNSTPKKKRKKFKISSRVLTNSDVIQEIQRQEEEAKQKVAKVGTKKRGRPRKHPTDKEGEELSKEEVVVEE